MQASVSLAAWIGPLRSAARRLLHRATHSLEAPARIGTIRIWLAAAVASLFMLPALAGTKLLNKSGAHAPISDSAGPLVARSGAAGGPASSISDGDQGGGGDSHTAKNAASGAGLAAATPSETPVVGCCGFTSAKLGFPTSPVATAW